MEKSALNWQKFDWNSFEDLILYLAEHHFDENYAERYLKQGNDQQGIDIRMVSQKTGKHLVIQCKHTKLSLSSIKMAIKEFETKKFLDNTDTFVLATTSDLSSEKTKTYLLEEENRFRNDYGLNFQTWDVGVIESKLKDHFRIVQHYFGLQDAQDYCFAQAVEIPHYNPVDDYIPRFIRNIDHIDANPFLSDEKNSPAETLTKILTTNPRQTKRICLISDPYEGKTVLLDQTSYELSNHEFRTVPLLIKIKDSSLRAIEETLALNFKAWKSIPAADLIVLIDGLDEVPMDQFNVMVTHIKDFIRAHPMVTLVYTCRKLFFHHFSLKEDLHNFDFYFLQELSYFYIDEYLIRKLGERKKDFYYQTSQREIDDLLRNPFYLTNLVNWYEESPANLPSGKIELVDKFIEKAIQVSARRKLTGGQQLQGRSVQYKKMMERFAFALQIAGLNAADKELVQELFTIEEQELLQNSSIISISGRSWSFYSAMFQEQLSAHSLINRSSEEILNLICVGNKVRKINTKWIQTIASYFSLVPEESESRKKILEFISSDNLELLTISDRSKFSPLFRFQVITGIIERCVRQNTRLLLVYETSLSGFAGNDPLIIDYLIKQLNPENSTRVKTVIAKVLKYITVPPNLLPQLQKTISSEIEQATEKEDYYGRLLIDMLSQYQLKDQALIKHLLQESILLGQHEFRTGIYRYLRKMGMTDIYYEFGLEGYPVLFKYNTGISHHGSERELEKFLLSTRRIENIRKLFKIMEQPDWQGFYHSYSSKTDGFIEKLAALCAQCFPKNLEIINSILDFLIRSEKKGMIRDFDGLIDYFNLTETQNIALQLYLIKAPNTSIRFYFHGLLTEQTEDTLLALCEDNHLDRSDLRSFWHGYFRIQRKVDGDRFWGKIEQAFGPEPERKVDAETLLYEESERHRKNNNFIHLSDPLIFEQALKALFKYFRKRTITLDELYRDHTRRTARLKLESEFLISFMNNCAQDEDTIALDYCLERLKIPNLFEDWRAKKILELDFKDGQQNSGFLEIIKSYYYKYLPETLYGNRSEDPRGSWYRRDVLLAQIWQKFGFETKDSDILNFLWVVDTGIKGIASARLNKRESLAESILNHFESKPSILKTQILKNLHSDINSEVLISSHLDFCEQLSAKEVCPIIIEYISSNKIRSSDRYHVIDLYCRMGGDASELIPFFPEIRNGLNYLYFQFVDFLIKDYPELVIPKLEKMLSKKAIAFEDKIGAAQRLAEAGNFRGFSFLLKFLKSTGKTPHSTQSRYKTWNVDTRMGLKEIDEIAYMLIDPKLQLNKFYESPDRFLLEIISGFAEKSEDDLLLVYDFLTSKEKILNTKYPAQAGDLLWHAAMITEKFRETNVANRSVNFIKEQLALV